MKIFEICDTTHGLTSPHGRQLPTDAGAPEERQEEEEEEEEEQEGLGEEDKQGAQSRPVQQKLLRLSAKSH